MSEEPTLREIRAVTLDTDGTVVWEDVDTGIRWNDGEFPTEPELLEIGQRKVHDCE